MGTLGDVKDLAILGALGVGAYLIFKIVSAPKGDETGPGAIIEGTGAIADWLWNPEGVDKALTEIPIIGGTYGIIPKILGQVINPPEPGPFDAGGGTGGGGGGVR